MEFLLHFEINIDLNKLTKYLLTLPDFNPQKLKLKH